MLRRLPYFTCLPVFLYVAFYRVYLVYGYPTPLYAPTTHAFTPFALLIPVVGQRRADVLGCTGRLRTRLSGRCIYFTLTTYTTRGSTVDLRLFTPTFTPFYPIYTRCCHLYTFTPYAFAHTTRTFPLCLPVCLLPCCYHHPVALTFVTGYTTRLAAVEHCTVYPLPGCGLVCGLHTVTFGCCWFWFAVRILVCVVYHTRVPHFGFYPVAFTLRSGSVTWVDYLTITDYLCAVYSHWTPRVFAVGQFYAFRFILPFTRFDTFGYTPRCQRLFTGLPFTARLVTHGCDVLRTRLPAFAFGSVVGLALPDLLPPRCYACVYHGLIAPTFTFTARALLLILFTPGCGCRDIPLPCPSFCTHALTYTHTWLRC